MKLPLDEPELELAPGKKHRLSDWATLDYGIPPGPRRVPTRRTA